MKTLSKKQKVINDIKQAGALGDTALFTKLLLNNKISVELAMTSYMQGQNLAKYALNKDTLTIQKKGDIYEIKEIVKLPTSKRTQI